MIKESIDLEHGSYILFSLFFNTFFEKGCFSEKILHHHSCCPKRIYVHVGKRKSESVTHSVQTEYGLGKIAHRLTPSNIMITLFEESNTVFLLNDHLG